MSIDTADHALPLAELHRLGYHDRFWCPTWVHYTGGAYYAEMLAQRARFDAIAEAGRGERV